MLWHQGWLHEAHRIASPNFGARPAGACVDLIVIHSISLPPGQFGGDEVERLFTNRLDCAAHPYFVQLRDLRVSAHFFVRRDGAIVQFVSTRARAWHAGVSHYRGRDNCNNDSVGIELEGLEGGHFEPMQYDSLARLCQALAQAHPIDHVAGHEHVAPGRKHDPGPGFDWRRLRHLLHWHPRCFPEGALSMRKP